MQYLPVTDTRGTRFRTLAVVRAKLPSDEQLVASPLNLLPARPPTLGSLVLITCLNPLLPMPTQDMWLSSTFYTQLGEAEESATRPIGLS